MKIQFFLESSQALLMVYEYKNADMFFEEAKKVIGVTFDKVGVLGKKTKFQVEFLAQLVVTGENNEWNWEDEGNVEGDVVMNRDLKTAKDDISEMNGQILKNEKGGKTPVRKEKPIDATSKLLPRDVLLDDDTLLDKIQFQDDAEVDQCELSPEQQALCLAIGTQLRKISASHKLNDTQQKAYMEYVLSGVNKKSVYTTRFKALLARSLLETEAWRTVERSLKQIECLIGCTAYSAPELKRQKMVREHDVLENRFKLFYSNLIPAVWDQKRALIDLLLKMGCGSTALDLLIGLKMYEDAAKVYKSQKRETMAVELLEKHMQGASEVDQVKYLCTLGDITHEAHYYFKGIDIVEKNPKLKNARLHRTIGYHFYSQTPHRDLAVAVEHFNKSVAINMMQNTVWFCLGCASMETKDWPGAVRAFRRSTHLEWDNFQAWANLSAALINAGNKKSAFNAIQQAVKCEYGNGKLWENYLMISIDIGEFYETIKAYHRLIDLKKKHTDIPVIKILVENYVKIEQKNYENSKLDETEFDIENFDKNDSQLYKKLKELIARNVNCDPGNKDIWYWQGILLGMDNENEVENDKAMNAFIRSFRCLQQGKHFPANFEELDEAKRVLDIVIVKYAKHHSVTTGIKSMLATVEKLGATMVEGDNKMSELGNRIKEEYGHLIE
jgi:tetratricopeptide (TPR) repeat protein